jgi:hypothetical protein
MNDNDTYGLAVVLAALFGFIIGFLLCLVL